MSTIPAVPKNTNQVKPWTGEQWVQFLIVLLLLVTMSTAIYAAHQAHQAVLYAGSGDGGGSDFSGSQADMAVQDTCSLLGVIAKKQGVPVSQVLGENVTDCSTAATEAAAKVTAP